MSLGFTIYETAISHGMVIRKYVFKKNLSACLDDWNGSSAIKLHSVKPVLGDWQSSYTRFRNVEIVLSRARTDHIHLTHIYIFKRASTPQCEYCQCILTVECYHLAQRKKDIFGRRDEVE